MLIAQITDTHINPSSQIGVKRRLWLERCICAINKLTPQPDFVIHTGDLTHQAGDDEFEQGLEIIGMLRSPIFLVPGNRDERMKLRSYFPQHEYLCPKQPFIQYKIDNHPVRFIALDTITAGSKRGEFCQARLNSLRNALNEDNRPTAAFMHHPPFDLSVSGLKFQFNNRYEADSLIETLNSYGNVVRVFCGHAHRLLSKNVGGLTISTLPSVAVDLRFGDYLPEQTGNPLFQLHKYSVNTGFTTQTITAK